MAVPSIEIRILTRRMRLRSVLAVVVGFGASMSFAVAEDAAPQSGAQLEEVLVTAERRESKLQDTPSQCR